MKNRERRCFKEGGNETELIRSIVEAPTYTTGKRPKRKLTEAMEQSIQEHLRENEEKRKKGQRKQQKKPMDIYEAMAAEDTVQFYVSSGN